MKRLLLSAFICGIALRGQTPPPITPPEAPARPTLTLAPAVVMVKSKPGEGWTQWFRMSNQTPATFQFEIEVQDVVITDGKRTYVPAGETQGGIASTAVTSPRFVVIGPQSEGTVNVTMTIPAQTSQRAVVVYFRGKMEAPSESGSVGLAGTLGALVTFNLSEDWLVEALNFTSKPQSDTTNLSISHELVNTGREVVIPKGSTAILDQAGKRVSIATFPPQRLIPGERLVLTAEIPTQLKPGHYRVVSSFEYEGRIVTAGGELTVP